MVHLAHRAAVHHGAQAAADQALDLLGAAGLLAAGGLAVAAGVGGAGQHAVFGGHPALALAAQEGRDPAFDAGGAEHLGAAHADQAGAFGMVGEAGGERNIAKSVGGAAGGAHGGCPVLGEVPITEWARKRRGMLKLGIVGAGIMGERMLRAALEHASDLVQVTGVWDSAPAALDRLGHELPSLPLLGSLHEAIEVADCVYIATPPASHLDYAGQALAAGKAVFLEKPLAIDVAAADAFARRHAGGRVAINFPFASSLAVQRLQAWIQEGTLAAPRGFEIEVGFAKWPRPWQQGAASWLDGRAEGGFTREVVSHFLFLTRRLLGPLGLRDSRAEFVGDGTERSIEARLEAGGVKGKLRGAVGQTELDEFNTWTLRGAGSVRLRDWSIAERQRPDGAWVPDLEAMPNEKARPLVLRRQLEQVVCMAKGEPHRLARLEEALEVQAVVEAILRA